ncbi:hypothetical protein [Barrientosiimonas endolithica]|uniref:Short chain dehydrogenase n=1 Tax=Barrientosiimonas endolithica TaxID=1535208 RepID=A0ABN6YMS0_9MICO|nr:hypothetical protein GCM10025872_05700 [Barrientosiimonas endolithica]
MTDTYSQLVNNGMGKTVATRLGLPRPATLRRYEKGQPLLEAPAAVGTVADGTSGQAARGIVVASGAEAVDATPETTYAGKLGAVVLDATAAATIDDLEQLRAILAPAVKALGKNGRVVILGTTPAEIDDVERAAVQQGLEGIMRSIGKELRAGGTANLLWLDGDAQGDAALLAAPLRFLLSSRSAYVSGQPLRVRSAQVSEADDWTRPYVGQTVVVTGAARGSARPSPRSTPGPGPT